jgi:hypothetical protein
MNMLGVPKYTINMLLSLPRFALLLRYPLGL